MRTPANTRVVTLNGVCLTLSSTSLALRSLDAGGARWFDCPHEGTSLWELLAVDGSGRRATLTGASAEATAWQEHDELRLEWRGAIDRGTGAGPFDITVTIRPLSGAEMGVAARIRVVNRSNGMVALERGLSASGGAAAVATAAA